MQFGIDFREEYCKQKEGKVVLQRDSSRTKESPEIPDLLSRIFELNIRSKFLEQKY